MDWCVIQLARRCVRLNGSTTDSGVPADTSLVTEEPLAPSDWKFTTENSFQFTSAVRTTSAKNNVVHGRLFRAQEQWANCPTAILLHGWNAELCYARMFPRIATELNRYRINTAMIELPYHMQRRPHQGSMTDFISGDLGGMLEATRQAIADVRALCRGLEEHGCSELGLWGFSLGAWLAGLIGRWEPALRFAVLTTPIGSIERAVAELPFCEPVRRSLGQARLNLDHFNLAAEQPRLARANILIIEARFDLFVPAETVERVWAAWGQPEIWRVPQGHISVLGSSAVTGRAVDWIAARARKSS